MKYLIKHLPAWPSASNIPEAGPSLSLIFLSAILTGRRAWAADHQHPAYPTAVATAEAYRNPASAAAVRNLASVDRSPTSEAAVHIPASEAAVHILALVGRIPA